LDLLAMAAENRQLKEKCVEQAVINESLRREVGTCKQDKKVFNHY